jgi:glycosyltransferase involved in cell wall biosynthesis
VPLRVLHVSETTDGGVGHVLRDLVRAQAERGWTVSVACPPDDRLSGAVAAAGGGHAPWTPGARPGPATPADILRLAATVRDVDPQVVHLHSSMAGLCGRLVVRRRRATLFQPHSWSFFAREGAARRAALAWERGGARWADLVLCVSEQERAAAQRAGLAVRTAVVPNGVDLERFRPADAAGRAATRRRLGVGQAPLVVCVGRLHRQKGQHRLLDVWPAVRERVPEAVLALVGEGADRPALQERAVPGCRLVGATSDVVGWLHAADVVAQPSVWEGMSLALLEAMACGRSVVVTDVPGNREVVQGGVGAVVPPDDPQALADALVARLLRPDLREREGRRGRARVQAEHDLDRQRDEVLRLTEQLAAGRA